MPLRALVHEAGDALLLIAATKLLEKLARAVSERRALAHLLKEVEKAIRRLPKERGLGARVARRCATRSGLGIGRRTRLL